MCRLLIFRLTFSFTFIMPDFMEPLLTKRGEEAARKAASEFAIGAQLADNDLGLEEDLENQADSQAGLNDKTLRVVENVSLFCLCNWSTTLSMGRSHVYFLTQLG